MIEPRKLFLEFNRMDADVSRYTEYEYPKPVIVKPKVRKKKKRKRIAKTYGKNKR